MENKETKPTIYWYWQGGYETTGLEANYTMLQEGRQLSKRMDKIWGEKNPSVFEPCEWKDRMYQNIICAKEGDIVLTNYIPPECMVHNFAYRIFPFYQKNYNLDNNQLGMRISLVMMKVDINSYDCSIRKFTNISDKVFIKNHTQIDIGKYKFSVIPMGTTGMVTNTDEGIFFGFEYVSKSRSGHSLEEINGRFEFIPRVEEFLAPKRTQ